MLYFRHGRSNQIEKKPKGPNDRIDLPERV